MGKIVITQNITADGVIESIDGWFDPQEDDPSSADILDVIRRQMAAETAFVVGRSTFEDMRGFWPAQEDDTTGITDHLNTVRKYVFSRSMTDPQWENTQILTGDLATEIARLRETESGDVGVTGSIEVCHQLISEGLVDEFRLFVFPRVLGRGRRLFPDGTDVSLHLVETQTFENGTVLVTYRPE